MGGFNMLLDLLTALYHFGNHYHSGQWSKGYLLQCQASQYAWREYGVNLTLDDDLTLEQAKMFFKLAESHGNHI